MPCGTQEEILHHSDNYYGGRLVENKVGTQESLKHCSCFQMICTFGGRSEYFIQSSIHLFIHSLNIYWVPRHMEDTKSQFVEWMFEKLGTILGVSYS